MHANLPGLRTLLTHLQVGSGRSAFVLVRFHDYNDALAFLHLEKKEVSRECLESV